MVRLVLLLVTCCYCSLGAAEAIWEFPAGIPPNVQIRATLKIVNFGESIQSWDPPEINNVEFLGIQNGGHFTQIINGVRKEERSLIFTMRFKKTGTYTIPEIILSSRSGQTVKTTAHKVTVVDNPVQVAEDCYAIATASPNKVVPGQVFTISYKIGLRTNKRLSIKQQLGLELPDEAIRKGDIRADDPKIEYDGAGNTWQVTTYYIDLTLPKSGSYTFSGQQSYGTTQTRIFNQFYREAGKTAIKPATVIVKDLPSDGQPKHFAGLVGPVKLQAKLDKDRIALGKNVILEITARDGQVDMLGSISVPAINGLSIYEGERESDEAKQQVTYYFTLVPKQEGNYIIPEIEVPYYDTESETYRSVNSESLSLTVIPGKARELGAVGGAPVAIARSAESSTLGSGMLLPAPYFGNAPSSVHVGTQWLSLIAAFLVGFITFAAVKKIKSQQQQAPKTHKLLHQAIKENNVETADRILHQMLSNLNDNEKREAQAFIDAIEHARFGKGQLDEHTKQQMLAWEPRS